MSELFDEKGNPTRIVCIDNFGATFDRYTVIFIGEYTHLTNGSSFYLGMSGNPFHPQGFCQHGEFMGAEFPSDIKYVVEDFFSANNGDEIIEFDDLPDDCKKVVMEDYKELWDMEE